MQWVFKQLVLSDHVENTNPFDKHPTLSIRLMHCVVWVYCPDCGRPQHPEHIGHNSPIAWYYSCWGHFLDRPLPHAALSWGLLRPFPKNWGRIWLLSLTLVLPRRAQMQMAKCCLCFQVQICLDQRSLGLSKRSDSFASIEYRSVYEYLYEIINNTLWITRA